MTKTITGFILAAVLWFVMFSPWTAHLVNFWYTMAASGLMLSAYAFIFGKDWKQRLLPASACEWAKQIALGIAIAAVLWCAFWVGDKLSQLMFDFARPQVDGIYGMKGDMPDWLVGCLLLFVIGPAEEIFWRGFLQYSVLQKYVGNETKSFGTKGMMFVHDLKCHGAWIAFALALAGYCFVHIWSFNFMLLAAAAVCGAAWGVLYRLFPNWFPALVISHALWDVAAFVIFPF